MIIEIILLAATELGPYLCMQVIKNDLKIIEIIHFWPKVYPSELIILPKTIIYALIIYYTILMMMVIYKKLRNSFQITNIILIFSPELVEIALKPSILAISGQYSTISMEYIPLSPIKKLLPVLSDSLMAKNPFQIHNFHFQIWYEHLLTICTFDSNLNISIVSDI